MPNADAIRWFKSQFHSQIEAAVEGTPFTLDFLTAIACQETGHIWNTLRKQVNTPPRCWRCAWGTRSTRTRGARRSPLLAAALGTAAMTPLASAGFGGEPWQEAVATFGFVAVGLAILVASGLLLFGFRRHGQDPGPEPQKAGMEFSSPRSTGE